MNHDQAWGMLADYLGDELDESQRRQFEAHLADDAELAAEVESLRRTLAAMHALDESVSVPEISGGLMGRPRRRTFAFLRYAAVILMAFGAGYFTNSLSMGRQANSIAGIVEPGSKGVSDNWGTRVAIAYANQPSRSGLARSLVALAHVGRDQ
ncbi:MAG: zf-HC2 domain-containing protein [Phycisphaerae bacterium]|nr:zf-HC2 domain-containing protein [Phycisphaerae bacterium]